MKPTENFTRDERFLWVKDFRGLLKFLLFGSSLVPPRAWLPVFHVSATCLPLTIDRKELYANSDRWKQFRRAKLGFGATMICSITEPSTTFRGPKNLRRFWEIPGSETARKRSCNQGLLQSVHGHMKNVTETSGRIPHCYILHHFVFKESIMTTKIRLVFDATCKPSSGYSLNDTLLVV